MTNLHSPLTGDDVRSAIADQQVVRWLHETGIEAVHVGIIDPSGTLREKRLSVEAAGRAFERGWSFIDAIAWWAPDDSVWRTGGSVGTRANVDPESGRWHPFEEKAVHFMADFAAPLDELSPRTVLAHVTERAATLGLRAEVAWEYECIVLDGWDGPLTAAMPDNHCWSALTMASEADVLAELDDVLRRGGVTLDHICAELGPGCLELATVHGSPRRSADDAAMMKLFTKAFFARRGQRATFMAQLSEEFPGLGGHPTLSLHSLADGQPVLADGHGSLSTMAGSAIAGVVALLPELLAMVAPNPNSFRRFAPGNWAPSTATWGPGNYSCALRPVVGTPEDTRLELRIPGADTMPHFCLAMFLGAAVWGIEQGLEPPPPVLAPLDGRQSTSAEKVPKDLSSAVDLFVASRAARDLFGSAFVDHYAASRLAEDEACRRFVPRHEQLRYLQTV